MKYKAFLISFHWFRLVKDIRIENAGFNHFKHNVNELQSRVFAFVNFHKVLSNYYIYHEKKKLLYTLNYKNYKYYISDTLCSWFSIIIVFAIYLFIKSFKISSCYKCKRSWIFTILEFSIHFLLPEFQSIAFHLLQDTFCNVSLLKFFIAALQATSTKLFIYNVFCFGMPCFIKVPDIHVLTICCKQ